MRRISAAAALLALAACHHGDGAASFRVGPFGPQSAMAGSSQDGRLYVDISDQPDTCAQRSYCQYKDVVVSLERWHNGALVPADVGEYSVQTPEQKPPASRPDGSYAFISFALHEGGFVKIPHGVGPDGSESHYCPNQDGGKAGAGKVTITAVSASAVEGSISVNNVLVIDGTFSAVRCR